jgi:hypothetical protein
MRNKNEQTTIIKNPSFRQAKNLELNVSFSGIAYFQATAIEIGININNDKINSLERN